MRRYLRDYTFSRLCRTQTSDGARTVVKAPKSCHITPTLRSLHWLRITERIECKLYKVLTTIPNSPYLLYVLISVQRPRSTRSSSVFTLARPPTSSFLKNNWSFLSLCFTLSLESTPFRLYLCQRHSGTSSFISDSPIPSPITSSSSDSPLCSSIALSLSLPA